MGLPASSGAQTARMVPDPLAMPRPKPSSARPQAGQERRQFLLALGGSGRPLRRSRLPALLGNASVPESRWSAQHPARREYSRRRGTPLREKPVPSATARSDLVTFDRIEPIPRVHSPIQPPFEIESRRCQMRETLQSSQPPSSNDLVPGLSFLLRICPWDPTRRRAPLPTTGDRALDSRSDPEYGPVHGILRHARVAPPPPDSL